MRREFDRLRGEPFDLLVVGGGIYGSWIAYDAALRGVRVALVERRDWAAGTSSASSKLIHGGLRYLEHLHFGLVRKSLAERRRLTRLGPHRIRLLRFVIPSYRGDRVGRLRWKLGLAVYDLLSGRDQPVAPHRSIGRDELLRDYPFLLEEGLRGGFSYGDCAMDDARYTLEIVAGGLAAGVAAVNRAEVTRLLTEGDRISGAEVRDREAGTTLAVEARLTVDCSGAWHPERPDGRPASDFSRMTKGVHLVMPALPAGEAFLLLARADGRVFFLIPWYGRTLLGTTDTPYDGDPDSLRVDRADVEYLLGAAGAVLRTPWTPADIVGSYVGLRVLQNQHGASPSDVTREWMLEQPRPGLLMPIGGKYTSARADSAAAVDRVMDLLGRSGDGRPTEERPLPWCPPAGWETWLDETTRRGVALGLDEETARTSACRFGSTVGGVHGLLRQDPGLAGRLHPEAPFSRAEVVHAVEAEMARTLEDVLRRRIPLALLVRPEPSCLTDAADLAGDRLGWSAEQRREQVAALLRTPHAAAEIPR